jgi:hypothetical protein
MTHRTSLFIVLALLAAGCEAWHFGEETKYTRAAHIGDEARLYAPPGYKYSFVAVNRQDCYELQKVLSEEDFAGIRRLAESDRIYSMDAGAKVKVLSDSFNERQIKLLEGPDAGKTGWVPFEWLTTIQPWDR